MDDVDRYKSHKGPVSELHIVDQYMMEVRCYHGVTRGNIVEALTFPTSVVPLKHQRTTVEMQNRAFILLLFRVVAFILMSLST